MKRLLPSLAMLIMILPAFGQSGVEFFKGTLDEALATAKKENKLVFIDTYADWCGPCRLMDRETFPDREVGQFMQENFISLKLDVDAPDGNQFANELGIEAIPHFVFMDQDGKVLLEKEGFFAPRFFLKMAEKAVRKGT